jgi:hypothetical protein
MARIGGKAVKTSAKAYILYVIMHSFIIYVITAANAQAVIRP